MEGGKEKKRSVSNADVVSSITGAQRRSSSSLCFSFSAPPPLLLDLRQIWGIYFFSFLFPPDANEVGYAAGDVVRRRPGASGGGEERAFDSFGRHSFSAYPAFESRYEASAYSVYSTYSY